MKFNIGILIAGVGALVLLTTFMGKKETTAQVLTTKGVSDPVEDTQRADSGWEYDTPTDTSTDTSTVTALGGEIPQVETPTVGPITVRGDPQVNVTAILREGGWVPSAPPVVTETQSYYFNPYE